MADHFTDDLPNSTTQSRITLSSLIAQFGLPIPVLIHHIFAILSSFLWLFSFIIHTFKLSPQTTKTSILELQQYLLLAGLLALYIFHLPFMFLLPIGSRPWIANKEEVSWRFYRWFMGLNRPEKLGWGTGIRAAVTLTLTGIPFLFATSEASSKWWSVVGILGLSFEGFFVAETVKHTDMVDGWFMAVMANAVFTAHGLFDYNKEAWIVFGICLILIFTHRFLPKYDDYELLVMHGFEEVEQINEEEGGQAGERIDSAELGVSNSQRVVMGPSVDGDQVEIECNADEVPSFSSHRSDSSYSLSI